MDFYVPSETSHLGSQERTVRLTFETSIFPQIELALSWCLEWWFFGLTEIPHIRLWTFLGKPISVLTC